MCIWGRIIHMLYTGAPLSGPQNQHINYKMRSVTLHKTSYIYIRRLATGWTGRRSNSVRARFSAPVQTGPRAHPASCAMVTGSLSRGWSDRGVALTTHPQLAPRLKKGYSYTSALLWAFIAWRRVNFTYIYIYIYTHTHLFENGWFKPSRFNRGNMWMR